MLGCIFCLLLLTISDISAAPNKKFLTSNDNTTNIGSIETNSMDKSLS